MRLVVDTHALIWSLDGSGRLGQAAEAELSNAVNQIYVPTLALAELQFTYRRGRHTVGFEAATAWIDMVDNATIIPLTFRMVKFIPEQLRIHDGVIVATALEIAQVEGEPCPVVTCDRMIVASGVVPIVW